MNYLYLKSSPWSEEHTVEELKEMEYTQLEDGAGGNGKGNENGTSIPVNHGIGIVLFFVLLFGLYLNKKWKSSRL